MIHRVYRANCKPWKKKFARWNRTHPKHSERKLWQYLKCKKLGVKFTRQSVILGYIVDFYSPALETIIECDGDYHKKRKIKIENSIRDSHLKDLGLKVLRFKDEDILNNTDSVLKKIRKHIRRMFPDIEEKKTLIEDRKLEKKLMRTLSKTQ